MLLINPTPAEALALLPAGTLAACLDSFPGGTLLALSTDGPSVLLATETHVGVVIPEGRMYHGRMYHGPTIEWQRPRLYYALTYNETLKCYQVAAAADEYALPADHNPVPDGFGAMLTMQYTRSTARIGGTGNDGHTLHRLKLPHTLDVLPGMFQQN